MSDDSQLAHPLVPVVLGLLLVAAGGFLFYSGMQAAANAEAVDATVTEAALVDTDDTGSEDAKAYTVHVEYEYTYAGETYTSTSLCPGAGSGCKPSSDFRTDMQEFLEDYQQGSTVTAYVQPSNPSNAYLIDTGPDLVYLLLVGFGVLLVALGVKRLRAE